MDWNTCTFLPELHTSVLAGLDEKTFHGVECSRKGTDGNKPDGRQGSRLCSCDANGECGPVWPVYRLPRRCLAPEKSLDRTLLVSEASEATDNTFFDDQDQLLIPRLVVGSGLCSGKHRSSVGSDSNEPEPIVFGPTPQRALMLEVARLGRLATYLHRTVVLALGLEFFAKCFSHQNTLRRVQLDAVKLCFSLGQPKTFLHDDARCVQVR